ncbi:MAG: hypothetical protein HUJ25_09645 [Crocinitomicaceae bacterium]|nr:hypothetical protein [Crocinitomicaceae bacterium]
MQLYLLASLIILSTACGSSKPLDQNVEEMEKAELVDSFDDYRNSAYVDFKEVVLEGNIVTLKFTYSGGCEEHNFKMIGMRSIGKTLPPTRSIMLYHDSNGDSCRELITETLTYNISAFGYKVGEPITLNLEGWNKPISYTLE